MGLMDQGLGKIFAAVAYGSSKASWSLKGKQGAGRQ
jgi:hypothetical protein